MNYTFTHLGKTYDISLDKSGDDYQAKLDGHRYDISNVLWEKNVLSFTANGAYCKVFFATSQGETYIAVDGEYFILASGKSVAAAGVRGKAQAGDNVSSPMPGLIVKIPVTVGESVTAGTTLAIVEAMKMQNELRAPRDGVVKKINCKEGEQVDALKLIVELE
jgi:biotin carboxyl carrier protein